MRAPTAAVPRSTCGGINRPGLDCRSLSRSLIRDPNCTKPASHCQITFASCTGFSPRSRASYGFVTLAGVTCFYYVDAAAGGDRKPCSKPHLVLGWEDQNQETLELGGTGDIGQLASSVAEWLRVSLDTKKDLVETREYTGTGQGLALKFRLDLAQQFLKVNGGCISAGFGVKSS